MSRTNYILVDYENVQAVELKRIANKPIKVILFLGGHQKNIPLSLTRDIHKYATQVELVETGRTGKNALDLVLAERIGEVRQADPQGYFHVISRDKDFDALIGYLREHGTLAARHESFAEIPVLMDQDERSKHLVAGFKLKKTALPKNRQTLESHIQSLFAKTLSAPELEGTIKSLITAKAIRLDPKGEVSYQL